MNFGTGLHDVNISKKAAIAVLDNLKVEHNFQDYELKAHSTPDIEFIGVKKNELIIAFMVGTKVAYELVFTDEEKDFSRGLQVQNFLSRKYGMFSPEKMNYPAERWNAVSDLEQHTVEFYKGLMDYDIQYMTQNYPEMIEQGKLIV